ncbi:MAG: hypothetical protein IPK33_25610 [Gemmatimonadetes bacterium]|nr:hypothetical protein [Gemmatimonadota bacterium]
MREGGSSRRRPTAISRAVAGNDVIVYDPDAWDADGGSLREIARFHFPRQEGRERLCLADYFRSVESGDVDVIGLQVVTVGDEATRRFEALQAKGNTARRSIHVGWRWRPQKRPPSGCTVGFAPSWGTGGAREALLVGGTGRARTWTTTTRSFGSSRPMR